MINCEDVLIDKLKTVISNSNEPIQLELNNTYIINTSLGYIIIIPTECIQVYKRNQLKVLPLDQVFTYSVFDQKNEYYLVDEIKYSFVVNCITQFVKKQYKQQLQQEKEKSIQKHLKHLNSIL